MCNECRGRTYEVRPSKQNHLNKDFIESSRRKQLINLTQWLLDVCYRTGTSSTKIISEFFENTNGMRRDWLC